MNIQVQTGFQEENGKGGYDCPMEKIEQGNPESTHGEFQERSGDAVSAALVYAFGGKPLEDGDRIFLAAYFKEKNREGGFRVGTPEFEQAVLENFHNRSKAVAEVYQAMDQEQEARDFENGVVRGPRGEVTFKD